MSYKNKLELFEYSPILGILPKEGDLSEIESYSSGLFARLENAKELNDNIAERNMLEVILEWLAK